MQRFLVNKQCISGDNIILEGDIVHQIKDVLRLQIGQQIIVFDNSGMEYTVTLNRVDKRQITGTIGDGKRTVEPEIKIVLYQSLLKSDRFEFVLQKCTEIGVSVFIPILCERCVTRKISTSKIQRWEKVIVEATEQSGRGVTPVLQPVTSFSDACRSAVGASLIANVDHGSVKLRSALKSKPFLSSHSTVSIFIGPEGGFTADESDMAQRCGIRKITLGPRVLRAETAGMVAATAVLYEYGELDRPPVRY